VCEWRDQREKAEQNFGQQTDLGGVIWRGVTGPFLPVTLFTKYHVRIVAIFRGASAYYRDGLAGRVCMKSLVASLDVPLEKRVEASIDKACG